MNTSPDGSMAPQRGWWSRNWKWVIPTGCLGLLASCGCLGGIFYWVISSTLKSSGAYVESVALASSDPRVQSALGTPIDPGFPQGEVNTKGGRKTARLTIPLKGPQGEGTLYIEATSLGEDWSYSVLQVQLPGQPTIDLRAKTRGGGGSPRELAPPDPDSPPPPEEDADIDL